MLLTVSLIIGIALLLYGLFLIATIGFRYHMIMWFYYAAGLILPYIYRWKITWWGILLYLLIYGGTIAGCIYIHVNNRAVIRQAEGMVFDILIILGCKTESKAFLWRIKKAAAVYQKDKKGTIITTGGKGSDELISEGEYARDELMKLGIPLQSILVENTSTSTEENLKHSDDLYHVSNRRTGIVTSDYHVYRSVMTARKCGYTDVFGVPSKSEWIYLPENLLRELFAYIRFLLY